MRANYTRPRELEDLSSGSKQRINDYYTKLLNEEINARLDIQAQYDDIEKLFLKYVMVVLHEGFGFGRGRCMRFLASWKMIGRRMLKFSSGKKQSKWMDERLGWFRDYPDKWVENMIEESKGETK